MPNNFKRKFASAWLGNDALNPWFTGAAIADRTYGWDENRNKTSEVIGGSMSGYGFFTATTTCIVCIWPSEGN